MLLYTETKAGLSQSNYEARKAIEFAGHVAGIILAKTASCFCSRR